VTQLLGIDDVAGQLGVSRRTVEKLLTEGDLPRVKVGARTLVEQHVVDGYVARLRGDGEASAPTGITDGQLRAFHAKANDLDRALELDRGDSKRTALQLGSRWFGREITSASDITSAAASRLLDYLDDELRDARS